MKPVHLPFTPDSIWWAYPWALLLLLGLPVLWFYWTRRDRRRSIRFSSIAPLRSAAGEWPRRLRGILPILRTTALGSLIVAAARPQTADESSRIFAEGIAIQLVVDTSGSMRDFDLAPPNKNWTRLDVVKDVIKRFVSGEGTRQGRVNDLIGLIRFARFSDSVCPLTLDHQSLLDVVSAVQIVPVNNKEEDGTAIGDALALAVERMKDLKRTVGSGEQLSIKSRIIILLTDGENNTSIIAPDKLQEFLKKSGEAAATYGIKVYTILAGTGEAVGYVMPDGTRVVSGRRPVDDHDLREIADITGGKFFAAKNAKSLESIYQEIDKLERTKTEERRYVRWGEQSWPFLMTAFACLALQMLLDSTRLRKIP